ncbi:MAG: energy transducer TonB [Gammaproteobacteria bacterium]|nr:energy transducer TonB [Gammaproteobacteria bacterium]NNJ73222.1 energy transducer TonB [Enterobacterales bacterium]
METIQKNPVVITNADRMSFSLFLAAAFHVLILLGITFALPDKVADKYERTLDVVLATQFTDERPDEADFIGQADQLGGGESDQVEKISTTEITPFPDEVPNEVSQPPEAEIVKPKIDKQQVLLTDESRFDANEPDTQQLDPQDAQEAPMVDSIYQRSMEIASITAQLEAERRNAAKKPKRRQVSASIHRASDALYLDAWRRKIERIGNVNYPEKAKRQGIYGSLTLNVSINADGTVNRILVIRSSGHKLLDDAAIRIVRLAAPFAPLTNDILVDTDILEIIRVWQFLPNNRMNTN